MNQSNVKHHRKNNKQKKKNCHDSNCSREHINGMNRKGITNKQKKKNCRFNENCYDPNCRREHTNGMNRKGITRSHNYHKKSLLKLNHEINKKNEDLKVHNLNCEAIISQQYKDNNRLYKENINVARYCCDLKNLNNIQINAIDLQKEEIEHLNLLVDDIVVGKEINDSKCMICYTSLTVETIYNGEEQECNCTMNVHKFCLNKFKSYNNMSCIICRKELYEEQYVPPPPPPPPLSPPPYMPPYIPPYIPPPPPGLPPHISIPIIDLTESSDGESVEEQYIPPNPPPTELSSPRDIGIELIRPAGYTPMYVIQPPVSPQSNRTFDL